MTLALSPTSAPLVATACRTFAFDLRSATELALRHLDEPFAIVAEPEVERIRLRSLLVQADILLAVAGSIETKLDSK